MVMLQQHSSGGNSNQNSASTYQLLMVFSYYMVDNCMLLVLHASSTSASLITIRPATRTLMRLPFFTTLSSNKVATAAFCSIGAIPSLNTEVKMQQPGLPIQLAVTIHQGAVVSRIYQYIQTHLLISPTTKPDYQQYYYY